MYTSILLTLHLNDNTLLSKRTACVITAWNPIRNFHDGRPARMIGICWVSLVSGHVRIHVVHLWFTRRRHWGIDFGWWENVSYPSTLRQCQVHSMQEVSSVYMSISPVSAHQLTIGKCRHSQTCRYVDLVIAMTLHNVCRCQLTMLTTSTNYTIQSLTPCAWVIDRSPFDVIVNFVVQVCIGCNNGIPKSSEVCLQGQRIFKSYRVSS